MRELVKKINALIKELKEFRKVSVDALRSFHG